jgi:hypothetical protein
MKKIINHLLGLFLVAALFTACTNYLDINRDPSYPATASTPLLFASGTAWSGSVLGCDVQLTGALWAQQYAQNNTSQQYTTIDQYNLANNSSYFTRYWSSVYAGALPDLKRVISQSETEGAWNYWLAAKVMTAFNYNMLVSLYEKIPFTEALMGDANLTPKFDDSKAVDAGIIAMLNEAIAKKADAAAIGTKMGSKDMVFGKDASGKEIENAANIDLWVKFAKTLKLKILMRDFSTNQAAIQTLLTEGDLLTTDAKLTQFTDAENKSNPLYENDRRKLNTTSNIRVSATLVAFLKAYNDPRIAAFCEPATQWLKPGATAATDSLKNVPAALAPYYRGVDQGSYGVSTFSSNVFPQSVHSRAVLAATDPVYFASAVESYFLQAEAWARIGNIANAKAAYNLAVKGAFSRWSLDGSAFIAAGGAYEFNSSSTDAMLNSILIQKWISSTRTDSWNAFFDICRTGIPALGTQSVTDLSRIAVYNSNYVVGTLTPSLGSVLLAGQFPHRFLLPKTSSDYNPNTPAVIPLYQKMWWHK